MRVRSAAARSLRRVVLLRAPPVVSRGQVCAALGTPRRALGWPGRRAWSGQAPWWRLHCSVLCDRPQAPGRPAGSLPSWAQHRLRTAARCRQSAARQPARWRGGRFVRRIQQPPGSRRSQRHLGHRGAAAQHRPAQHRRAQPDQTALPAAEAPRWSPSRWSLAAGHLPSKQRSVPAGQPPARPASSAHRRRARQRWNRGSLPQPRCSCPREIPHQRPAVPAHAAWRGPPSAARRVWPGQARPHVGSAAENPLMSRHDDGSGTKGIGNGSLRL